MTHLWIRAEQRPHEARFGVTPAGIRALVAAGLTVTLERSSVRALPDAAFAETGATFAPENSWPDAPADAIILGLKELPEDGTTLPHRHILFGHAFKGQPAGQDLLRRFEAGGGTLYDLEYLVDEAGRRVAAFGHWAGYAGAAVALRCWAAQNRGGGLCAPVHAMPSSTALLEDLQATLAMAGPTRPTALIIGALGRVGTGARDLCREMGVPTTDWDMAETASGGPFPEVLAHDVFLNCILARPGTPVFVPTSAKTAQRRLSVIGDIACDPTSDFSPIKVYDRTTDWDDPALRVHAAPPLDVTAIDNLPSMLPVESSEDFADQLLPHLIGLTDLTSGVWGRADATFQRHIQAL
ncbi:saccharopine dehydrogenase [Roseobacteraceae bacterium S113]